MRIFYQHNVASTRIGLTCSTRALSYGRLTLAIRHSSQLYPNLVASNMLNTATAIFSPGKATPITYTPFGFAQRKQQASVGFNGEYPDLLTGNYGLGHGYRWYSPALKRFQAADNISPFGLGGIGTYAYTHNDPVNSFDTDGHQQVKHYTNLKPIRVYPVEDGVMGFFSSQVKGGKRNLFVDLHGENDSVIYANKNYSAKQFPWLLKKLNINLNDYQKIHFTSCHSGKNFAPELTRLINKPVKAPAGVLMASNTFDHSTNSYVITYLTQPDADFFHQPRKAPVEDYVFGLQKFVPPQTKAQDIRHSVKTGR